MAASLTRVVGKGQGLPAIGRVLSRANPLLRHLHLREIGLAVKHIGGRREVLLRPDVTTTTLPVPQEPKILQAAMACVHSGQRMLNDGRVKSIGRSPGRKAWMTATSPVL